MCQFITKNTNKSFIPDFKFIEFITMKFVFVVILYIGFAIGWSLIPTQNCSGEKMFTCTNGECIRNDSRCDNENYCGDDSDEIGCKCNNTNEFPCNNTKCIKLSWKCDGEDDCGDRSDELDCSCAHEFKCNSTGICIPWSYRCDYQLDCADMSDEIGCKCEHGFMCVNNTICIPGSCRCDGDFDCSDRSDELNCSHSHIPTANPTKWKWN